ncbi:MAG TPA: hypothetical protein VFQ85_14970 [Mycobacteriales bacterium]|jgi:hypothetical protein|nr:hypothetical protein [Mycobacteriales bacterium]
MTAEPLQAIARHRLHQHFAARRTATAPDRWFALAWAKAVFALGSSDEERVLAFLDREWAAFRASRPGEPVLAFRPPPPVVRDEEGEAGPPPYELLPRLRHGRYGIDLPSHEERIREEQERLARRDQAHYGF